MCGRAAKSAAVIAISCPPGPLSLSSLAGAAARLPCPAARPGKRLEEAKAAKRAVKTKARKVRSPLGPATCLCPQHVFECRDRLEPKAQPSARQRYLQPKIALLFEAF